MFETRSILDKNFYEKFYALYDSRTKEKVRFFAFLFVMSLIVLVPLSFLPYGFYIWILFLVCYFWLGSYKYKSRANKYAEKFITINKEQTNKETVSYITSLSDEGIKYKNLDTQSTGVLNYDKFICIYDIDGYYYLVMQSGRGLPINKNSLSEQERIEIVEYLKEKLSNVKWVV